MIVLSKYMGAKIIGKYWDNITKNKRNKKEEFEKFCRIILNKEYY